MNYLIWATKKKGRGRGRLPRLLFLCNLYRGAAYSDLKRQGSGADVVALHDLEERLFHDPAVYLAVCLCQRRILLEWSFRIDRATDVKLALVVVRSASLADVIKFSVEGPETVRTEGFGCSGRRDFAD